jgi:hypothetical protein
MWIHIWYLMFQDIKILYWGFNLDYLHFCPKNLKHSKCIINHNHMSSLEILALCIRCCKGLIAYHKVNGIIAVKEHVEFLHKTLLTKYLEHVTNQFWSTHYWEPNSKKSHITLIIVFYFYAITTFTKKHFTQKAFMEDVMLYVVKEFLPLKIVESIWSEG